MESIGFVILLVLGAIAITFIWLIVRAVQSREEISELKTRVNQLDEAVYRLRQSAIENPPVKPAPAGPKPEPVQTTQPIEPVIESAPADFDLPPPEEIPAPPEIPEPVEPPPISEPVVVQIPPLIAKPEPVFTASEPTPTSTLPPTPKEKGSFEMRLGTYWLVRIGAVMLLTGLVFFGNLAYHNFIVKLGPGGKIGLLYLASFALLGAGAWWLRKATKEALKNYGQVVFATGLAAVYFTTYVAHHVPALCVIGSAVMDGALLLAWAGFIVWIADWKKSEVLALFAVVLAYYSSIITAVGAFTLYSNLVLTAVAVAFLLRNRWAGLTFASLIGTYGGYAFWRFFHNNEWHWAKPEDGLWFGIYFLVGYWLMFTAAGLLSKNKKYVGPDRAAFLTLNNGAFFGLFILTMLQVNTGGFWKLALAFGTVLLVLAELSRRFLPDEPATKNAYATQGLLLVTLGFIFKFAGLKLALVLGAESVVLYVLGTQRQSIVLKVFSYASAGMAVGWALTDLKHFDPKGIWMGSGLGALMMANAIWAHRTHKENKNVLRPEPAFFSALALIAWGATTWFNTHEETLPLIFAVEAALFTFSIYVLRVREVTLLGQLFLAMANGDWIVRYFNDSPLPPWWNPLILLGITLGLSHWWQKQKIVADDKSIGFGCQVIYALAIVGIIYGWLQPLSSAPDWLALTNLLAVAVTAYGVFTRAWALAICGQIFLVISLCQFVFQVFDRKPDWYFPLAPIAAMGLLSFATMRWFAAKPDSKAAVREPLLKFAMAYRWAALVLSLCWIQQYVHDRERAWVFMAVGAAIFAFAGWRRSFEAVAFGAVYSIASLGNLWMLESDRMIYLPNLLAILVLFVQQQVARRSPSRYKPQENIHTAAIIIASITLWRFTSCWVSQSQSGFYLTASWSALALVLLVAGIILGERMYRWAGLGILAVALGRVVVFDVWKQETTYRVLTFMALGVVLLALGFLYNKYQDKIRKWL